MKRFPNFDLRDLSRLRAGPLKSLWGTLSRRGVAGGSPLGSASPLRSLHGLPSMADFVPQGRSARRPPAPPVPDLPAGARFEERSHVGASGSRNYKIYVPSTYDGTALPLVVMLHGCT